MNDTTVLTSPSTKTPLVTKLCSGCGYRKPLTAFERVRKGSEERRPRCKICRLARDRRNRQKSRCGHMKKELTRLSHASCVEDLHAVATTMVQSLGGNQRFAELFGDWMLSDPNSSSRWRGYVATLRTLEALHVEKSEEEKVQRSAERQLEEMDERQADELVNALVEKREDLILNRLRERGWRIWKPGKKTN